MITVYPREKRGGRGSFRTLCFRTLTRKSFAYDNSPYWREYLSYKKTDLYSRTNIALCTLVNNHRVPNSCLSTRKEILKLQDNLGVDFISNYASAGFTLDFTTMLGMQLFEICLCDKDHWWLFISTSVSTNQDFIHSDYYWQASSGANVVGRQGTVAKRNYSPKTCRYIIES